MYRFKSIKSLLCVLSLLWLCESTYAAAFYTAVTETSATSGYLTNITEAIWTNNAVAAAKLGNQVTNNAVVAAGGNDYVAVTNGHTLSISVGTLLRVEAPYTFPGASLTLNTNVILYIQGVGKTNTISNLILNGGVVMNNDGNAGALGDMLAGSVQAAAGTVSYFCLGSGVLGTGSANHTLTLLANVTGSGDLLLVQGAAISATNLNVVSSSNPFSGRWIVRSGYLKGTGIDSLGTNSSFIVDPLATQTNTYASGGFCAGPSVFEAGYDINSAGTLTLTNGGTMVLHQSCAFTAVTINGTSLANGTYYYSTLTNMFPSTFAAGGSGGITVQPYNINGPPVITEIVNQIVFQPVSYPAPTNAVYAGQTVLGTVLGGGAPPLSYQWWAGATGTSVYTNLLNQNNISGVTSTTLTISNMAAGNAADYVVVVTNSLGCATSSVVTLTVLATGSAENITMTHQEPVGKDWNTGTNWSDGEPAWLSVWSNPGSTYEVLPAAVMRTPTAAITTFPGTAANTVTIDGDGNFLYYGGNQLVDNTIGILMDKAGAGGTVNFPRLIMNGGEIDTGGGSYTYGGEWDIMTNTPIFVDAAGDSGLLLTAYLTGTGTVEWDGPRSSGVATVGDPYNLPGWVQCLTILGTSNTFSGQWKVENGNLLGVSANCLGTNTITIGDFSYTNYPTTNFAAFETLYDINNPNGTLNLIGVMYLHQNDTFRAVNINGVPLSTGIYTAAQLSAAYPTNFPASWTALAGSAFSTASGSITVLGPSRPGIASIGINGVALTLTATNGVPNGTYYLLTSSDMALPLSEWTPVLTNVFDGFGNLNLTTNVVNSSNAQQFYILQE